VSRFADQLKHKAKADPSHDKSRRTGDTTDAPGKPKSRSVFGSAPFVVADDQSYAICPAGPLAYGRRIATMEPVFANIRRIERMNRFTLPAKKRSIANGSFTPWCTTSRSGQSLERRPEKAE
jgi:hypothetical protein